MLFVFLQVLFFLKAQNLCTQQPLLSGQGGRTGFCKCDFGVCFLVSKGSWSETSCSVLEPQFWKGLWSCDSLVGELGSGYICVCVVHPSIHWQGNMLYAPHTCTHTHSHHCVNFTLVSVGALGTLRRFLRSFQRLMQ